MPYTCRVFKSIRQVPMDDWLAVHESVGDPFTDPRFFEAVERSMGRLIEYRPIVFYDEMGRAAAISSVSTCKIDASVLAGPRLRKFAEWVRRLWSNYLQFKIIMCGLPVTVPQKKLCLVDGADAGEVLRLLDEAICRFAAEQRSRVILVGDFDAEDCHWLDALKQYDYRRFDSLPLHRLELPYESYDDYLAAMRAEYRNNIKRDLASFKSPSLRVEELGDGEMPSPAMTDEFYQLYLQLLKRVDFHLMTLPNEFYEEFLQHFSKEVQFLRVFVDDKPAAFTIGLVWEKTYYFMDIAVDARVNDQHRLYFNLMHQKLGVAMGRDLDEIVLGITADHFKLRLGSCPRAQRIYVKATGWLRWPFQVFGWMLFPTVPDMPPNNVFRKTL